MLYILYMKKVRSISWVKFTIAIFLCLVCFILTGCNTSIDVKKFSKESTFGTSTSLKKVKDYTNNYYLVKNNVKDFKILNLSDIHFGNGTISKKQDEQVLKDVKLLIEQTNPDLIILNGDNVYPFAFSSGTTDNLQQMKTLATFLESFQIPWTLIFGNHDNEFGSKYSLNDLGNYLEKLNYCLFTKGPETVSGVGNQIINIRNTNGRLLTSLILFDSHSYYGTTGLSGYDNIHQDQIDWYKSYIIETSQRENFNSIAFLHIPIEEYKEAWQKYKQGSDEVTYYFGDANEKNEKITTPEKNSDIFNTMVELKNTTAIFAGHNHLNDFSIKYKGIRLTFNSTLDNLAYVKANNDIRGGTVIEIDNDKSFYIYHVKLFELE